MTPCGNITWARGCECHDKSSRSTPWPPTKPIAGLDPLHGSEEYDLDPGLVYLLQNSQGAARGLAYQIPTLSPFLMHAKA